MSVYPAGVLHQFSLMAALFLYVSLQAFWNKMCIMPTGDPSDAGCAEGAGLCVSPALLCLHHVQPTTGHRGRVLPHGGREAGVQGGL